jgi:hypothetical protein
MTNPRKISSDTAFFRILCDAALNSLGDYYEAMEGQLTEMKDEDRRRFVQQLDARHLKFKDEYLAEYDIATQQHDATFNMLFTNFFRFSYVVLLALVLEDWMGRLWRASCEVRSLRVNHRAHRHNIVQSYQKCLSNSGVVAAESLWQNARDLYTVRNCIVHDSGKVSSPEREQEIKELLSRTEGLEVSNRHKDSGTLQPLYLEDGMLLIQPAYCRTATDNVKRLFNGLCEQVPLHELQIEVTDNQTGL